MDCWQKLGIAATADKREIKRAYAKLIKQNNPEDNPNEFQAIREAYDQALMIADYMQRDEEQDAKSPQDPLPSAAPGAQVRPAMEEPAHALREKDKVRGAQLEAIDVALAKLVPLLQQDESTAIAFCESTLKDEFYQALDVRYEFEGRLLVTLVRNDLFQFAFVEYLAHEFNWGIDIYRKGEMVVGHFDNDVRFSGAFYAVAHRYLLELVKLALKVHLQSPHQNFASTEAEQLEVLLFSEGRELELAEYCNAKRHRALIEAAYVFLTTNQFITRQSSFVPWKTLQWLIEHKIVRPVEAAKPRTSQPQKEEKQEAKISYWMVWLAIVFGIRLIASIVDDFDSNRQSPPQLTPSKSTSSSGNADIYAFPREKMDRIMKLQRDAEANDPEAQYTLAQEFLRGGDSALTKDTKRALNWLKRAAEQEYAPARETLGILYYTGEAGVQDYKIAVDMLTWAADHGRGDATFWLARAFDEGKAVERNAGKARKLLDRASELGSADAMRIKGMNIIYGRDPERNPVKGEELLKKSADMGNLNAAYQLAQEYLSGEHLELNYEQARKWLDFLSARRILIANFLLSQLYEKGLGVPQDSAQSKRLLAMDHVSPKVVNEFAWQLVTHPNKQLRNGDLAVQLMEPLLANPKTSDAVKLDTLAAAYAETGQFDQAVRMQQRALNELPADASASERSDFAAHLKLYQNNKTLGKQ